MLRWEAKKGEATPHADAAYATLMKAMLLLPPAPEKAHACLDEWEIVRQVETLLRDREFLPKQLPPEVAEKVRGVLDHDVRPG